MRTGYGRADYAPDVVDNMCMPSMLFSLAIVATLPFMDMRNSDIRSAEKLMGMILRSLSAHAVPASDRDRYR